MRRQLEQIPLRPMLKNTIPIRKAIVGWAIKKGLDSAVERLKKKSYQKQLASAVEAGVAGFLWYIGVVHAVQRRNAFKGLRDFFKLEEAAQEMFDRALELAERRSSGV